MPLYDYECDDCEHLVENVLQSFNDKPLKKCPKCKKMKLFRLITGGLGSQIKAHNTVGSLMDKNHKIHKGKMNENAAKERELNPPEKKPWYHGSATNKEINKMTPAQKTRYIMEGKK